MQAYELVPQSSIGVTVPHELLQNAQQLAAEHGVSLDRWIAACLVLGERAEDLEPHAVLVERWRDGR